MATVRLKPGHVQPVWAGHPWVYAQAVDRVEGGALAGDEVTVLDPTGRLLGRGLYSPQSAIVVRLHTRDDTTHLDAALLAERIAAAARRRAPFELPSADTTAYRLVHAEGDDLPGLVVDRFDDVLAVQLGTVGMKRREVEVLDALGRALHPRAILDRTPQGLARAEGFVPATGVVRGDTTLTELAFRERGLRFRIPLELGQKTGFYLDQRPLRARVEALSAGRRVLDTFTYVGAIALGAARGGAARVVAVDRSALALEVAAECAAENGLAGRVEFTCGDALDTLHHIGRQGGFDLVVCDPPKLAPSRAAAAKAAQAMRRLCGAGCAATTPGGLLVVSSCSAALGLPEVTRALALGARDVGTRAVVVERLFQGPDHPVPAPFVEGLYLSTVIAEVTRL